MKAHKEKVPGGEVIMPHLKTKLNSVEPRDLTVDHKLSKNLVTDLFFWGLIHTMRENFHHQSQMTFFYFFTFKH